METRFEALQSELTEALVAAAHEFGMKKGLGPINEPALHQCQFTLAIVAQEMLFFGFDCWPMID